MKFDPVTLRQAEEYADTEAEIGGFSRDSARWQKAYKQHLSFAYETLSLGRNPRNGSHKYKVMVEMYPEVFGANGFAGEVAKKYSGKGQKGLELAAVQDRILSTVMNLAKLFEGGVMEVKGSTSNSKQGKISNNEMSDLQFPNKEDFSSEAAYKQEVDKIVKNWFMRDLISDSILELLMPFFTMSRGDVGSIMNAVTIEEGNIRELMTEGREEFVKRLRAQVEPKIKNVNYKKLVLGGQ